MSFRIEQKYRINKYKLPHLYKWISKNNGEKVYLDRTVSSIYFDNYRLSSYHDSVEGVIPRKKIRLRWYDNIKNKLKNSNLEKKINSVEGKFKKVEKATNPSNILKLGILDNGYGLCFPVLQIDYNREYFKIFDIRITVDTKIRYKNFKEEHFFNQYHNDDEIVLEAKALNTNIKNFIDENIYFEKIRFSKYCNAIEKLNYYK